MLRPNLPTEGGCRCGRVRFRVTAMPLLTVACHCRGCQRMSASAFSLSMAIPEPGFEVIDGDPVIGGLHGDQSRHHHCDWCKSWLFTRLPPQLGFVNVRPTMLDDPAWYVPFIDTMLAEALPWATTPARHRFEGFPDPKDYEALLASYTASIS